MGQISRTEYTGFETEEQFNSEEWCQMMHRAQMEVQEKGGEHWRRNEGKEKGKFCCPEQSVAEVDSPLLLTFKVNLLCSVIPSPPTSNPSIHSSYSVTHEE